MSRFLPPESESAVAAQLRSAGSVFAEDEARLLTSSAPTPHDLADMVDRRVAGEPLEYILGWAEFCGMRIAVEPGVFVPRLRTEFLVSCAAALCRPGSVVVDVCCGSGAVGAAVLATVPGIELHASDIDPAAVRCASRNLRSPNANVVQGDLFEPLPRDIRGRVDLIVANAPYVPTGAIRMMPPEARLHEARVALDGGTDGLEVHRRLAAEAGGWLAPDGSALVETSSAQAEQTAGLFADAGLRPRILRSRAHDATVVLAEL
jgi:release factor glutamine methyltransferase